MNYIFLASLILTAISCLFSLTRQYQMLQQNSYFPSRYCHWVSDSYVVELAISSILFCAAALLYDRKLYTVQLIIIIVFLAARVFLALRTQKKSVIKLKVTSRVKRLYATATIILAALICGCVISKNPFVSAVFMIIVLILSFVSPILALVCRGINTPAEMLIAKKYTNEAKKILDEHKDLIVIGVTGSYGKTSTKFILERILSEKYNVVATPQSFNTPMGVVKTVREMIKPQTQVFICEMGAKKPGDIKEICDIVNPKYGIITSVGSQHLDTFKSVKNVFKTKFELADAVFQNDGEVFVNGDSKELSKRIDPVNYSVYGTKNSCNFRAESISYGKDGSKFILSLGDESIAVSSKLLGLHSIINITGAAALASLLGVDADSIKFACASLKATEHRLEMKPYISDSLLIDDAYNANPEGCLDAVHVLGSFEGMQKVIVTPGLIELGDKEYECNYALGLEAAKFCDIIILVGKNRSKPMSDAIETTDFDKEKVYVVGSFAEALEVYKKLADSNTVVLFENDLPDNYLN